MSLTKLANEIDDLPLFHRYGFVHSVIGVLIKVKCPKMFVGELCYVFTRHGDKSIKAQVVGFEERLTLLMAFESPAGIAMGSKVIATDTRLNVLVSEQLVGRVVDAFSQPIDRKGPIDLRSTNLTNHSTCNPLDREIINQSLVTGISAIDSFLTFGRGQRLGVFAGSGVGKSSLMASLAKNINEDINVIALIGERGREVGEFIEDTLGEDGMKNSIVVVATADEPPLTRIHAVNTAIAIAEFFSRQQKNVLFLMDSITRYAMAMRDVGLAVGEPPTLKGYTPSVFSTIPDMVERFGAFKERGNITAVLSVLVDAGDWDDPIVDAMRAILDGHVVLTRELAEQGHYPAIDVLKSTSRLFTKLNQPDYQLKTNKLKKILANYEQSRELFELNSEEEKKQNATYSKAQEIKEFLKQALNEQRKMEESKANIEKLTEGVS